LVWDETIVNRLKYVDNKWVWAIEYIDSFSDVERKFFEGPKKRLLEEIPLWIKMLIVEKGLMHMEPEMMIK
jgi:hypothetical protein